MNSSVWSLFSKYSQKKYTFQLPKIHHFRSCKFLKNRFLPNKQKAWRVFAPST
jgi:hypothetical protein